MSSKYEYTYETILIILNLWEVYINIQYKSDAQGQLFNRYGPLM